MPTAATSEHESRSELEERPRFETLRGLSFGYNRLEAPLFTEFQSALVRSALLSAFLKQRTGGGRRSVAARRALLHVYNLSI